MILQRRVLVAMTGKNDHKSYFVKSQAKLLLSCTKKNERQRQGCDQRQGGRVQTRGGTNIVKLISACCNVGSNILARFGAVFPDVPFPASVSLFSSFLKTVNSKKYVQ